MARRRVKVEHDCEKGEEVCVSEIQRRRAERARILIVQLTLMDGVNVTLHESTLTITAEIREMGLTLNFGAASTLNSSRTRTMTPERRQKA